MLGLHPSKVQITKLHMDPDRTALLNRRSASAADKNKGKYSEENMANVD